MTENTEQKPIETADEAALNEEASRELEAMVAEAEATVMAASATGAEVESAIAATAAEFIADQRKYFSGESVVQISEAVEMTLVP